MILIYSNSDIFGGVEILILRFIDYLKKNNIEYNIIEDKDSHLSTFLDKNKIVSYNEALKKSNNYDALFFGNVCKLLKIDSIFRTSFHHAKILAWVVHPNEIYTFNIPNSIKLMSYIGYHAFFVSKLIMPKHFNFVANVYKKMLDNNVLFVMDEACKRVLSYFDKTIICNKNNILPIPVPVSEITKNEDGNDNGNHKIGYFGRMDKMKYSALRPFIIKHLSKINNVELHFIGVGSKTKSLERLCLKYNIKFIDYGFKNNNEAKEILRNNTEFCVAMGTSALDIASSGHPCLIINPAAGLFYNAQSKFIFTHEISGYTLGEYIDFPLYEEVGHSLEECFDIVTNLRSDITINYLVNNHNPDVVFSKIHQRLVTSEITLKEIDIDIDNLQALNKR